MQGVILLIGVPAGLIAAHFGGKIDTCLMRTVDALYSIPSLLFIIVIMTFLRARLATPQGPVAAALAGLDGLTGGLIGVFIGVGLITWMPAARLVRGTAVSLKEKEFVEAARAIGASNWRIMAQHLLPNVVPIIVVTATIGVPQAIIYEAGISFLGLGARPPMPSLGLMIAEAIPNLRSYPYMLVSPALALSCTVLAFNFFGDGLRDASTLDGALTRPRDARRSAGRVIQWRGSTVMGSETGTESACCVATSFLVCVHAAPGGDDCARLPAEARPDRAALDAETEDDVDTPTSSAQIPIRKAIESALANGFIQTRRPKTIEAIPARISHHSLSISSRRRIPVTDLHDAHDDGPEADDEGQRQHRLEQRCA